VKIEYAEFVTSATEPDQYPWPDRPEIAFGGRSNVGKSSLINTLIERQDLVETSKQPGRTRTINFFDVNDEFYVVDLPGYGYAKVSREERKAWGPMIETYLQQRRNLEAIVCVMDVRRGLEADDLQLIEAAPHFGIQAVPVFTKADKLGKQKRQTRRREIADILGVEPDEILLFSSEERIGKRDLWRRLEPLVGIGS
jgi:GTP-binding protein